MCTEIAKHINLKIKPEDFIVAESMILPYSEVNQYHYYILEKSGYTTFEAIEQISLFSQVKMDLIGYAGLKDEDGVTKQHISVPEQLKHAVIERFNLSCRKQNEKFIRIFYVGGGNSPIKVGELCGNNFRLVARKVTREFAQALFEKKYYSAMFINYYGPQRFGLPKANKTTHLIGEHLLNGNYDKALEFLKEQPSSVGEQARSSKNAQQFFGKLDQRLVAFYQSAYYSHQWNERLKEILQARYKNSIYEYNTEGLSYVFFYDSAAKLASLREVCGLEYTRVVPIAGKFGYHKFQRLAAIQMNLQCNNVFPDDVFDGYWAVEIMFFLPSGCYATIALSQVFNYFYFANSAGCRHD